MSISVKILQTSCCDAVAGIANDVKTAASRQGLPVSIEKVSDLKEVMKHDTSRFPALVINGEVHPWEEVEGVDELERLLKKHQETTPTVMEKLFDLFTALADYLVFDVLELAEGVWHTEALHFFIANFSKITFLLIIAVYVMRVITEYLSYDRIGAYLESHKKLGAGNLLASLLGAITPFCSCSSVPLFVGMMRGRVPLGISLSFLITSPLVNEVAIAVFWASYGWRVTLIYVLSGVILGVVGGILLDKMGFGKYVADWIGELDYRETVVKQSSRSFTERIPAINRDASQTVGKLIPYVMLGMGVGAFIHGYVPEAFFDRHLADNSLWSVPLSVLLAIPLYLDAVSVLPVIESLIGKGVPMGTAIAFMMGAIGLSLPEALLLKKVMKKELLIGFFTTIGIGMILSGYFFNLVL